VRSVDVLRGLVMFAMVFVNDVAGVKNAPWWMKHYSPSDASGMTFVDVVFPAFLFIVGMSVPLAFESRRARGEKIYLTLGHVLLRTLELLLLGFVMVNMGAISPTLGMSPVWWRALAYGAMIATFLSPSGSVTTRRLIWIVKAIGATALIFLLATYRTKDSGWMTPQWWGILGLIGWAYLLCSISWVLSFNLRPMLYLFAIGTMTLFVLGAKGTFDRWWIQKVVDIGTMLGSHASIAIMGAIIGWMLRKDSPIQSHGIRIMQAIEFAIVLSLLAILLHSPWGINKNAATPAWCLWSSAITTILWAGLYAIVDIADWKRWSWFFAQAGGCALMIYLLHPLLYQVVSLVSWEQYHAWGAGEAWTGITRAMACAIGICLAAVGLSKVGLRLKL
jgi:predicted acyltransferase